MKKYLLVTTSVLFYWVSLGFAANIPDALQRDMADSQKWDEEHNTPNEFRTRYEYDSSAGSLKITEPFTNYGSQRWKEDFTEREILISAHTYLLAYPLASKQIQKYEHLILLKGKTIFHLTTDRSELDALEAKLPEYDAWMKAQPDPYESIDASRVRDKAYLNLLKEQDNATDVEYYKKIFSNFKNIQISFNEEKH